MNAKAAVLCQALLAACGCDGGSSRQQVDAANDVKCGATPAKLADYVQDVPDAGRSAVQVPTIGAASGGLFYLLNWSFPLEAGGGRGGYLVRVPTGGGERVRLAVVLGGGSAGGQGLDTAGATVVFSEAGDGASANGAIVSVPAAGGSPVTLASSSGLANAVAASESAVFFVDGEGTKSVPLSGGSVRVLTTQKPNSILIAGSTLYLADGQTMGTVSSMPADGGQVTVLATEPAGVIHLVRCGDKLCWMSGPALNASLKQLEPDGSVTTLAVPFSQPHDVVFDGKSFFVSSGGGGFLLHRIPAAGGPPALVQVAAGLSSLDLDDDCLYWSSVEGIFAWALSTANTAPDPSVP